MLPKSSVHDFWMNFLTTSSFWLVLPKTEIHIMLTKLKKNRYMKTSFNYFLYLFYLNFLRERLLGIQTTLRESLWHHHTREVCIRLLLNTLEDRIQPLSAPKPNLLAYWFSFMSFILKKSTNLERERERPRELPSILKRKRELMAPSKDAPLSYKSESWSFSMV